MHRTRELLLYSWVRVPFTPLEKTGLISFLLDQIVSLGEKKCVEWWEEHLHDDVAPLKPSRTAN